MRIDRKIKIRSSPKRIYDIVIDGKNTPKWNLGLDEVIEKEEGKKYLLKTNVGDILIVDTKTVENKRVIWYTEQSDMNSIGYILKQKGECTEVKLCVDFDNKKFRERFEETGELVLRSLKIYIDFIEEGGNPDEFSKQIIVSL